MRLYEKSFEQKFYYNYKIYILTIMEARYFPQNTNEHNNKKRNFP